MYRFLSVLVGLVWFGWSVQAQTFPLQLGSGDDQLRDLKDTELQENLEEVLKANPQWKSLIAQKKMSVGLVDLSNQRHVRYAAVNEDHMMYAASLPKIAVLLTAMEALEQGELAETPAVKSDMRLMISKSNNQATTRMIDRVGLDKIASVMTKDCYDFYDKTFNGGLWVGKRYAKGGATNREPLKNLSHAATVSQVCRFYYMLAQGKLVNKSRSMQMLKIMENPALHHKFVNTLDRIAPNARIFRKSGSWSTFHADSALVWGKGGRKYILVALVNNAAGEQIIRNLVRPVEQALQLNM